jgi:hypothetical protein
MSKESTLDFKLVQRKSNAFIKIPEVFRVQRPPWYADNPAAIDPVRQPTKLARYLEPFELCRADYGTGSGFGYGFCRCDCVARPNVTASIVYLRTWNRSSFLPWIFWRFSSHCVRIIIWHKHRLSQNITLISFQATYIASEFLYKRYVKV